MGQNFSQSYTFTNEAHKDLQDVYYYKLYLHKLNKNYEPV